MLEDYISWAPIRYDLGTLRDILDIPSQLEEERNSNMEKKFSIALPGNLKYKTYEEAEKEAKRFTQQNGAEYTIMQAIATTVQPVPEIEVVKL